MGRLRWVGVCLAVALAALVLAADEVLGLPDLDVRGEGIVAVEPAAPRAGLAGELWAPEVRLAPQGLGAQTDLSIRGSTFSGAGLAVGGLSLRNPQTEHFNTGVPLPPEWFGDVRVVTGLDQAHAASGHLVGSIAAEFAPLAEGGQAELGLTEAGGHEERLIVSHEFADAPWAASLFGTAASRPGRDYTSNGARGHAGGLHLQYRDAQDQLDGVLAVERRDFGARGFYGVSPAMPASETTEDILLLGSWRHDLAQPGDFARLALATRRFADEYTLDEANPSTYRNDHRTLSSSAAADGRVSDGAGTGAMWRLFVEDERLESRGLWQGNRTAGLGDQARQRLGALVLPFQEFGPLTLEAGGQAVLFSAEAPALLALAGVRWAVRDGHECYLSYTETVRQPSFTELDYESPASLGNQGLENEESAALEAGWRSTWTPRVQSRLAAFQRRTEHSVDWLRMAPGGRWLATDVGDVVTRGLEAEVVCRPSQATALTAFAAVLRKDSQADYYASRYVFDYPEERLGLALSWQLTDWCEVRTDQAVLWYAANPARGSDRCGSDVSVQIILRAPSRPGLGVVLACSNLLDDDLELYPGQRPAGRTVSGTLAIRW